MPSWTDPGTEWAVGSVRWPRVGGFAPEAIINCVACWIADDIAQANGSAVTSWLDRVAGYSLAQGNSTFQPSYATSTINGQPGVDFVDGDYLRYAGSLTSGFSGHVFVVADLDLVGSSTLRRVWYSCDEGSATTHMLGGNIRAVANGIQAEQRNNDTLQTTSSDGSIVVNTPYLLEWSSDGAAYDFRIDNTPRTITGTNNGDWFGDTDNRDNFTIGARRTNAVSANLDGQVCMVIVVDGAISSGDRSALNAYVTSKWGITLA